MPNGTRKSEKEPSLASPKGNSSIMGRYATQTLSARLHGRADEETPASLLLNCPARSLTISQRRFAAQARIPDASPTNS